MRFCVCVWLMSTIRLQRVTFCTRHARLVSPRPHWPARHRRQRRHRSRECDQTIWRDHHISVRYLFVYVYTCLREKRTFLFWYTFLRNKVSGSHEGATEMGTDIYRGWFRCDEEHLCVFCVCVSCDQCVRRGLWKWGKIQKIQCKQCRVWRCGDIKVVKYIQNWVKKLERKFNST